MLFFFRVNFNKVDLEGSTVLKVGLKSLQYT